MPSSLSSTSAATTMPEPAQPHGSNGADGAADRAILSAAEQAFSLLQGEDRAWAREFVLDGCDGDAADDVAALSNPVALRCGTAMDLVVVASPPAAAVASPEARRALASAVPRGSVLAACRARYLKIPAWTNDGITVGAAVEQREAVAGFVNIDTLPQSGEPPMLMVGRFARCERTGETVLVMKTSRSAASSGGRPMVNVIDAQNESSTLRKYTFMHCDWVVLASRPRVPASFAAAALCCETALTDRECPVCGRPPTTDERCHCVLPMSLPRGPLDFTQFRSNGMFDLGRFSGLSSLFMRHLDIASSPLQSVSASVVMTASPVLDAEYDKLARSMQTMAIQERLSQAPSSRGLPTAGATAVESVVPTGVMNGSNGGASNMTRPVAAIRASPLLPCAGLAVAKSSVVLNRAGMVSATIEHPSPPLAFQGLGALQPEMFHEFCVRDLPAKPVLDIGIAEEVDPAAYLEDDGGALMRSSPISEDEALQRTGRTPRNKSAERSIDPEKEASAPVAIPEESSGVDKDDTVDPKVAARLERQRKNRLAASKSNARRKERRETLERNLREVRAREQELKSRHATVLARNTELKDRAANVWVSKMKCIPSENGSPQA